MIVQSGLGLQLVEILAPGDIKNERVHLEATRDLNTSFFVVLATHEIPPDRVYAGKRPAYWFEPIDIKNGDHVILYTRSGSYSKKLRNDRTHYSHFFYWDYKNSLFDATTARAIILEVSLWETGR
jgi:hypothetical protein